MGRNTSVHFLLYCWKGSSLSSVMQKIHPNQDKNKVQLITKNNERVCQHVTLGQYVFIFPSCVHKCGCIPWPKTRNRVLNVHTCIFAHGFQLVWFKQHLNHTDMFFRASYVTLKEKKAFRSWTKTDGPKTEMILCPSRARKKDNPVVSPSLLTYDHSYSRLQGFNTGWINPRLP